jgi:hypothetical protein
MVLQSSLWKISSVLSVCSGSLYCHIIVTKSLDSCLPLSRIWSAQGVSLSL